MITTMSNLSNKCLHSLVVNFGDLVINHRRFLAEDWYEGSPSYGAKRYKIDMFDMVYHTKRYKTVAFGFDHTYGVNGKTIECIDIEIVGKDFLVQEIFVERIFDSFSNQWSYTSTVWDNKKIVLSDMYKIDWCGDISDLEGAISYLNIMKSTVDTM